MSCYVAYFTVEAGPRRSARRLQAVCGRFVDYPREHSTEPTCGECAAYVMREREEDDDTLAALRAEYPNDVR